MPSLLHPRVDCCWLFVTRVHLYLWRIASLLRTTGGWLLAAGLTDLLHTTMRFLQIQTNDAFFSLFLQYTTQVLLKQQHSVDTPDNGEQLSVTAHQHRRLASSAPFQERDGLVVMEAESVDDLVDPWVEESNVDGFTGTGFLRFTGNRDAGGDPVGRLSFPFSIARGGTYRLAIHGYKPQVGTRTDLSNDCYTKLVPYPAGGHQAEDTKMYLGGNRADTWGWAKKHEPSTHFYVKTRYELTPGDYALEVSGRSRNFRIDRIVLFEISTVDEGWALDLARTESLRDDEIPPPTEDYPLTLKLLLVKAESGDNVRRLKPGIVVDLSKIGTSALSVRCNFKADPSIVVDKVRFELGNRRETEDTTRPYTLSPVDNDGTYKPVPYLSRPGPKTITATALAADGLVVGVTAIAFTVAA